MKKYLFLAASALALASCSSDDFIGNNGGGQQNGTNAEITFSSNTGRITRAGQELEGQAAATALGDNFVVVGFKGSETAAANAKDYAFDHYNVNYKDGTGGSTLSNTAGWEYVGQDIKVKGINKKLAETAQEQTIKYWDQSCASYDFLAFSLGKGYTTGGGADISVGTKSYATPTAVQKDKLAEAAYTLDGDANTLSECYISDIKTVEKGDNGYTNTAVKMNFRHLTSKVRIALYETVPGYVISDVKFHSSATDDTQNATGQLYGLFNEKGTYTVYFPTTGTANKSNSDYNKAHVKFKAATTDGTSLVKDFGKVNYNNQEENQIPAGSTYLSQTASAPSYCGATADYYQTVLPSEDASQSATIRIDYKLTATDGTGEVINVKNATATVPAEYTKWKPGYAYTYKFKISQNTNGSTGGDDDPKGLTAISFDAVVENDEQTGQETITTVSTPSITTYGFKDGNVTANMDEYVAGTAIYATVYVPEKGTKGETGYAAETTAAPQKLYTISIEDGAAQSVNEASVANAIEKGGKADVNGKKLTATEVSTGTEKVTEVPAKDGHNLTVNALKWTAETAGTIYAVEYEDADGNKTYKIVNIAK